MLSMDVNQYCSLQLGPTMTNTASALSSNRIDAEHSRIAQCHGQRRIERPDHRTADQHHGRLGIQTYGADFVNGSARHRH